MKISGIICEYNPFHNGHLYHIQETRRNGATHIVVVMSGNFTQRGDVSIIDKHDRAKLAVRHGADLVIELPVLNSLSSAENFASGAVWILSSLGCVDELSFGSECGDVGKLLKALEDVEYIALFKTDEIRSIMEKGYTYPKALNSVMRGSFPESADVISKPNNMLAIEYLRALKKFASPIEPFTVMRIKAPHDSMESYEDFASATYIRENILLNGRDFAFSDYMPSEWAELISDAINTGRIASLKTLERVILYKLRTSAPEEIAEVNDVGQGLENRIYSARMSSSLEELLFTIKTKRYTMARLKRIIMSLLIGIKKEDTLNMPPYARILALNERGSEILAQSKKYSDFPFSTSMAKLSQLNSSAKRFAELEARASDIYGLAHGKITSAEDDFRAKIMLDME